MALFRRSRSRFPADMPRWLETFGRYTFDLHSGIDDGEMWSRIATFHEMARSDRDGFLTDLRAVVADDRGGFATFGAARVVWELFGGDALHLPAALPIIDAGIAFKRARGLPTGALTGYEMQRLRQTD
ncbi:hypothetical protein [Actinoplanes auranticolor]|uniref:Uncharacterized protein n=1 Tax=Actinoplanes auranticolor TaxID=47988 RepID=A0A919S926_9ACTN|nr:hypothetical protein [Actinoplanes auranticolor]GIM67023.1 hypothetical protein Aau02nite_25570 [Actinoplanes auranticolor]